VEGDSSFFLVLWVRVGGPPGEGLMVFFCEGSDMARAACGITVQTLARRVTVFYE